MPFLRGCPNVVSKIRMVERAFRVADKVFSLGKQNGERSHQFVSSLYSNATSRIS